MSSIDLVILGIVLEKPQSAYDIQKDVEYHHLSRWTKISVPSIYRKVLQLSDKGYLQSDIVKGDKFADKADGYDLPVWSRSAGAPRPCCKSAGRDPYQTGERQNQAAKQVWQPVGEDAQTG